PFDYSFILFNNAPYASYMLANLHLSFGYVPHSWHNRLEDALQFLRKIAKRVFVACRAVLPALVFRLCFSQIDHPVANALASFEQTCECIVIDVVLVCPAQMKLCFCFDERLWSSNQLPALFE